MLSGVIGTVGAGNDGDEPAEPANPGAPAELGDRVEPGEAGGCVGCGAAAERTLIVAVLSNEVALLDRAMAVSVMCSPDFAAFRT